MQGIYTSIPETNHVAREHCVATILMLFMVLISLGPALTPLYLYIGTFRSVIVVVIPFGPKRGQTRGVCVKLNEDTLHSLFSFLVFYLTMLSFIKMRR